MTSEQEQPSAHPVKYKQLSVHLPSTGQHIDVSLSVFGRDKWMVLLTSHGRVGSWVCPHNAYCNNNKVVIIYVDRHCRAWTPRYRPSLAHRLMRSGTNRFRVRFLSFSQSSLILYLHRIAVVHVTPLLHAHAPSEPMTALQHAFAHAIFKHVMRVDAKSCSMPLLLGLGFPDPLALQASDIHDMSQQVAEGLHALSQQPECTQDELGRQ